MLNSRQHIPEHDNDQSVAAHISRNSASLPAVPEDNYCDNALIRGKCIDMPLFTFLAILAAGMLVGYGVLSLYNTFINNEDIP